MSTGTRTLYNAGVEPKNAKRMAGAKKAAATRRQKVQRAKLGKSGKGSSKKTTSKGTASRGPTAFFVFSAEQRPSVKKKHPAWKVTEIASELGKQWRALRADQKQVYLKKTGKA